MANIFRFKTFAVQQDINTQKVGTDSMLLGAWSKGNFKRVLDIGTGTGILALMLAQQNPTANITAIEPDLDSLNEAKQNFKGSIYSSRLLAIHATLQNFASMDKYDLIISNPPYFNNTFLSQDDNKNRTRQSASLAPFELYESASELLSENGQVNVIIPFEMEDTHLIYAADSNLHPQQILRTVKPGGGYKRSLIQFSFASNNCIETEMIIKNSSNQYSPEYVALTKDFYEKNLTSY
ncbi:tRNA1(Val) (adenine(37)-N6)-methyltransferase [Crocinitomix catalasitica]|uniref:tRNA1(Val) (adenine(37)-N6)-methyltransferase n=1 Tax=Crocinitomix catalasitica TaxID=184607 RepID=UPI000484A802|nr:methyltransferase [Crocinitomix catalasitica]